MKTENFKMLSDFSMYMFILFIDKLQMNNATLKLELNKLRKKIFVYI